MTPYLHDLGRLHIKARPNVTVHVILFQIRDSTRNARLGTLNFSIEHPFDWIPAKGNSLKLEKLRPSSLGRVEGRNHVFELHLCQSVCMIHVEWVSITHTTPLDMWNVSLPDGMDISVRRLSGLYTGCETMS